MFRGRPESKKPSGSNFPSRHLLPTEGLESQGLKALVYQCGDINTTILLPFCQSVLHLMGKNTVYFSLVTVTVEKRLWSPGQ